MDHLAFWGKAVFFGVAALAKDGHTIMWLITGPLAGAVGALNHLPVFAYPKDGKIRLSLRIVLGEGQFEQFSIPCQQFNRSVAVRS